MLLSVIIPVFNEKLSIEQTFFNLELSLKKNRISKYEIIFINDSSYDGSNKVLLKLKKKKKI